MKTDEYPLEHPPGHYASPYPDLEDVRERQAEIFDKNVVIAGIDMREEEQFELLQQLAPLYASIPYGEHAADGYRYHSSNRMFSGGDAAVLAAMLQHIRPQRVIEVGSGFSSAVMLDMAEHHLGYWPDFTFIEPYPDRLNALLGDTSPPSTRVITDFVQQVDPSLFATLEAGDVLFIDSSHVCRPGGDVNQLFFSILPALASGVHVHVHDVFHPFEYLPGWIYRGRAWNEIYILRSFLMYNEAFDITLFANHARHTHSEWLERHMPILASAQPGSFWMRKR